MLERIMHLMEQLGITKNKLAIMSGLSRTTVYHALSCEENCRKTQLETMRPIAAALNTTLDYIIKGDIDNINPDPSKCIVSIGRGGTRVEYEIDEADEAVIKAFMVKFRKDNNKDNNNEVD